jgi:hypothetical protein
VFQSLLAKISHATKTSRRLKISDRHTGHRDISGRVLDFEVPPQAAQQTKCLQGSKTTDLTASWQTTQHEIVSAPSLSLVSFSFPFANLSPDSKIESSRNKS